MTIHIGIYLLQVKLLIMVGIIIATAIVSSIVTAAVIPKEQVSFYPEWLEKNIEAAHRINDSEIPIIGVDVDEQLAVLTIYMTEENSKKYSKAIDELINVPYEILTDTESKELKCLRLYKEIREASRTTQMQLAQKQAIESHKKAVFEYVENNCPDFPDLELTYNNYKQIQPNTGSEKISTLEISKKTISNTSVTVHGWTYLTDQEIVVTVTAPNGNIISIGNITPMNDGKFTDSITTGGPLWKKQDGIYTVTVQQTTNSTTHTASFELELEEGKIITRK